MTHFKLAIKTDTFIQNHLRHAKCNQMHLFPLPPTQTNSRTPTCCKSKSLIWVMVKLFVLSGCRLWARRVRSCVRKCVWSINRRSRQGNSTCTTPGSSCTSSSMPRLNTPSMIRSVRTWWISVWISSEMTLQSFLRFKIQHLMGLCWTCTPNECPFFEGR